MAKSRLKNFAVFSGIAIQMGLIITLGVFVSVWTDEKYGFYPFFTIIGSLLSIFLSLYIVFRKLTKLK